jgi:uncharacterized protein (TIGR02246 family)
MGAKVPDIEKRPELEQRVREVMDRWKSAIDAHEPQRVAEQFTEDAIFQGLRPYSVGRQGVIAYYDSQPVGMTVAYRVLETRPVSADAALGYLHADFSMPDQSTISVRIGVLVTRGDDGWRVGYYQASPT